MTSGESDKRRILLAVATTIVGGVIFAAIVTLSLTGSDDESASSAKPFISVTPTPKPVVTTPGEAKISPPTQTRTAKEQTAAALSPDPAYTSPAQPAAQQPEPSPVATPTQCPTGAVSAQLTSVGFELAEPDWEGDPYIEVTVTAHGVFTNGTSSPLAVDNADIPNLLGLDERGDSPVMERYGTYESPSPPPGEPNTGEFILEPGASVVYTAVSDTSAESVRKVKYWQADSDGYVLYYPFHELISCPVSFTEPIGAKSIPNTFAG
jgi:hypothetical protein